MHHGYSFFYIYYSSICVVEQVIVSWMPSVLDVLLTEVNFPGMQILICIILLKVKKKAKAKPSLFVYEIIKTYLHIFRAFLNLYHSSEI